MKSLEQWFQEYGESHRHPRNRLIHKICVPLIFFSVVGFVLLIPWRVGPLPVGDLLLAGVLMWYLTLGFRAFAVMFVEVMLSFVLFLLLREVTAPLPVLLAIFILAWIGQFIGHKIEGRKPSFFQDLQFLLIGPLWVLQGTPFLFRMQCNNGVRGPGKE